ncbi:MAG: penicillin-binding protein 2 [Chloroflexi bacterium]|nr:penicillin-binding protein 2 [Chloroflexota bacterium]
MAYNDSRNNNWYPRPQGRISRLASPGDAKVPGGRVSIFRILVLVALVVLMGRVYQLQFLQGQDFVLQADSNRFDRVSIPATRGIIIVRNGVPLAINVASANVTVTPALLPLDEDEELAVLERLASLIGIPFRGELDTVDERGIPEQSLLTMVRTGEGIAPFRPVVVEEDINEEIALLIIAEGLPGVDIEWTRVRDYPTGALTAHVIGYMGPIPPERADEFEAQGYRLDIDRIGYDGIEFEFDPTLAGVPGQRIVERDVAGEEIRTVGDTRLPIPGYSLRLTIDTELQERAQGHLIDTLNNMRGLFPDNPIGYDRGVVIAMDPRSGEILAMVSYPTYDNSRFARTIDYQYYLQVAQDPQQPLFNQAISSLYPPGSIFKMITLTGILEEGIMEPEDTLSAAGEIQLVNRYYPNDPVQSQTFVCWLDPPGHGDVNAVQSLAWSCDIYFYKAAGGFEGEVPTGLGVTRLGAWMDVFGFNDQAGVELPGEIDGFVPDPDWKRRTWGEGWSTGDTYNSSFGQGYVVATPLQMLHTLNIYANDGIISRPTLIREIIDADGNVVQGFTPDQYHIVENIEEYQLTSGAASGIDYMASWEETLAIIKEGMRAAVTVEGGTAQGSQERLDELGITTAGKTGTAEFCDNIAAQLEQCEPGNWPAHAWYMGYAPYENPEISVIAFVYNGAEGSSVALPIATAVMRDYFELKAEREAEALDEAASAP